MRPIPIVAGRNIAEQYGYDQVVIVARKVGDSGGEHVTTYGRDKIHCDVAARIGNFFKHKLMGWPTQQQESKIQPTVIDNDSDEITVSLEGRELRGWSYSSDGEWRQKMLQAREYIEGWCDGREATP